MWRVRSSSTAAMDLEAKFDLLLKTIAENERKREEAEVRSRAEYLDLKKTVESRIPAVEKRVDELGTSLQSLNTKVDHLEGLCCARQSGTESSRQGGEASNSKENLNQFSRQASPTLGMNDNSSMPRFTFGSCSRSEFPDNADASFNLSGTIPPMTCLQFSGDNPQMWKVNCEQYFDVYGIRQAHWVKIATLNFSCNAFSSIVRNRDRVVLHGWVCVN